MEYKIIFLRLLPNGRTCRSSFSPAPENDNMSRVATMMDADDDLYSGYDYNSALDISAIDDDIHFQQAIKTSMGKRPTVCVESALP